MSYGVIWERSIPGRGHSKCKGPGVSACLAYSRKRKDDDVDLMCVCVCVCVTDYKSKECSWKDQTMENE